MPPNDVRKVYSRLQISNQDAAFLFHASLPCRDAGSRLGMQSHGIGFYGSGSKNSAKAQDGLRVSIMQSSSRACSTHQVVKLSPKLVQCQQMQSCTRNQKPM